MNQSVDRGIDGFDQIQSASLLYKIHSKKSDKKKFTTKIEYFKWFIQKKNPNRKEKKRRKAIDKAVISKTFW